LPFWIFSGRFSPFQFTPVILNTTWTIFSFFRRTHSNTKTNLSIPECVSRIRNHTLSQSSHTGMSITTVYYDDGGRGVVWETNIIIIIIIIIMINNIIIIIIIISRILPATPPATSRSRPCSIIICSGAAYGRGRHLSLLAFERSSVNTAIAGPHITEALQMGLVVARSRRVRGPGGLQQVHTHTHINTISIYIYI